MSAWIKMRTDLREDKRVMRMADDLELPDATIIGGFFIIWAYADTHTTDGKLGITPARVDKIVGIPGFATAASHENIDWIGIGDDGMCFIPRFNTHNGDTAKKRAADASRKATKRSAGRPRNVRDVSGRQADKLRTPSGHLSELEQEQEQEQSIRGRKEIEQKQSMHAPEPDSTAAGDLPALALPGAETERRFQLRRALAARGIKGRQFERLAESRLTAAIVDSHWQRVSTDPRAKKPIAVLVTALMEAAGLTMGANDQDPDLRRRQIAAQAKRWHASNTGGAA